MKDKSFVVFILDRSGSMGIMRQEAIDGYNGFLEAQKAVPGEADIKLVLFSTERNVFPSEPLATATPLSMDTYAPYGMTALWDAIALTMKDVGDELAALPEGERPDKVIFAILTDGQENSSWFYAGEMGRQRLADEIKHQQDVYGWQFSFLGANMDAKAVAVAMNIPADNSMSFEANARGLAVANDVTTANVARMRTST